jgi:hypothetical protein
MLLPSLSPVSGLDGEVIRNAAALRSRHVSRRAPAPTLIDDDPPDEAEPPVEWSEEEVVNLHWRMLQEIADLSDPAAPLETKLDTLRWVFTEVDKDGLPFSFVNCLRVVGNSPLSPIAYCGAIDAEAIRDGLRGRVSDWLRASLKRYPDWVRQAVASRPDWVGDQLEKNPQWINEQVKAMNQQGDLFA